MPQVTTHIYDAAKSPDDLHYILKILFKRYPNANFYLAGSSFGACIGVRYVTNYDHDSRVKGIVSMANPFDIFKAAEHINTPSNRIFAKFMVKNLLKKVHFNKEAIKMWEVENQTTIPWEKLEGLSNTFEFDELFTFKIHPKYIDHKTYYDKISCSTFVDKLEIPALFLHSKDDPICP